MFNIALPGTSGSPVAYFGSQYTGGVVSNVTGGYTPTSWWNHNDKLVWSTGRSYTATPWSLDQSMDFVVIKSSYDAGGGLDYFNAANALTVIRVHFDAHKDIFGNASASISIDKDVFAWGNWQADVTGKGDEPGLPVALASGSWYNHTGEHHATYDALSPYSQTHAEEHSTVNEWSNAYSDGHGGGNYASHLGTTYDTDTNGSYTLSSPVAVLLDAPMIDLHPSQWAIVH